MGGETSGGSSSRHRGASTMNFTDTAPALLTAAETRTTAPLNNGLLRPARSLRRKRAPDGSGIERSRQDQRRAEGETQDIAPDIQPLHRHGREQEREGTRDHEEAVEQIGRAVHRNAEPISYAVFCLKKKN
eukprot:TRINITY_DN27842_c0_g1_i1.p1 TRINITY_DN27842_c0_g1~~TRINITY_DN27842_c0_g1_i1.p1  ORF type:complete len:131 (+),score=17.80 TRINITY_DN27842_c0_g1_i1:73-465(+)